MTSAMTTPLQNLYHDWAKAAATLLWCHWKLLDARYEVAARWFDTLREPTTSPDDADARRTESPTSEAIARRAAECMRKGLPPPSEIYEVQNRGRLDWSQFPEWARPSDPELFEGCSHEG
jgi:hypothetical protein